MSLLNVLRYYMTVTVVVYRVVTEVQIEEC